MLTEEEVKGVRNELSKAMASTTFLLTGTSWLTDFGIISSHFTIIRGFNSKIFLDQNNTKMVIVYGY